MLLDEVGGDVGLLYIEMPKLSPNGEAIGGQCWTSRLYRCIP